MRRGKSTVAKATLGRDRGGYDSHKTYYGISGELHLTYLIRYDVDVSAIGDTPMANSVLNRPAFPVNEARRFCLCRSRSCGRMARFARMCKDNGASWPPERQNHPSGPVQVLRLQKASSRCGSAPFSRIATLPLHLWLQVIHLMCASKKGISTRQIQRMLNCSMKTAWFLGHRIRRSYDPCRPIVARWAALARP